MLIIGLTGKKGSGKDTVAEMIWSIEIDGGHIWASTAYAAPLKQIVRRLFDLSYTQMHGTQVEKEAVDERWGKSPRELLQIVGTDIARKCHPEVWIRRTMRHIDESVEYDPQLAGFVITDVRFPNEADAIKARGGVIVNILRPDLTVAESDVTAQHESEQHAATIPYDYQIINDGTLMDLRRKVAMLQAKLAANGLLPQTAGDGQPNQPQVRA